MPRKRTGGIEEVDGRRYARVTVALSDGRKVRRRVRLDDSMTKRAARQEAAKLSREAEGFVFDPRQKAAPRPIAAVLSPTVDNYHEEWAADRERRGRVSERGRYVKHIAPVLGARKMRDVTKDQARQLAAELDEKVLAGALHWTTAVKVWGIATKMFNDAVESKVASLRVLEASPFANVKGPDRGEAKAKQWLYPVEAATLLACEAVPFRWRRIYALAIYLYLRPGELAGLEWGDVHLGLGYVNVHQALDLKTGEIGPTKTKHTRKVPIPPALAPMLAAMFTESAGAGRVVQHEHDNKTSDHGLPPVEDLAATLRAHLQRAGVTRTDLYEDRATTKRVTFYDLRATGITWEVLAGTEHVRIMQRAGHANFSTTQLYIREAESVGVQVGEPFPPLPAALKEKATGNGLSGASSPQVSDTRAENGRPQRDSNPCYSLERAVSWAGLDDGDRQGRLI